MPRAKKQSYPNKPRRSSPIPELRKRKRETLIEMVYAIVKQNLDCTDLQALLENGTQLSLSRLRSIFHTVTGITLGQYIRTQRIEKAKLLLKETNDKCYRIARQAGFSDESSFIRSFHRVVGITPACYRRVVQNNLENSSVENVNHKCQ